ncbi:hypothetical protein [Streptomyces sp. NPDC029003]|uniref:hypothetical protein n=1 Tax=Streptomyces sp. NPDC029003 TaxID=3155125 RepID=UPI0033E92C7D
MTPDQMRAAEELVREALVPYGERTDALAVAGLVDRLISAGQPLYDAVAAVPRAEWAERAGHVLADWAYFLDAGPLTTGDHANWNYARGLARVVRSMVSVLRERETAGAA